MSGRVVNTSRSPAGEPNNTLAPVDIADGDEVTVRGTRYRFVSVSEWRATGSRFAGYVILCGGGDG